MRRFKKEKELEKEKVGKAMMKRKKRNFMIVEEINDK